MSYLEQRLAHINAGRPLPEKKKYVIPKVSKKLAEKQKQQKAEREPGETDLQKWFNDRRKEMVGTCQCGCGGTTSKHDDLNFRSSIAHLFPQRLFPSVATHPLNWVERNFWEGCHSNMDNRSMDLWPNMADWEDIKVKCQILVLELTDEEKGHKFFTHIQKLLNLK